MKINILKRFILLLCIPLFLTACNNAKTIVLFNTEPITKDNFLNNSTEFSSGKRIYYLFITEKPLDSNFIRVRVLKRNEKVNFELTELVYSNDFRLYKDQIYYYNDYIVIETPGDYCMVVYAINKLDKPLVTANFRIK